MLSQTHNKSQSISPQKTNLPINYSHRENNKNQLDNNVNSQIMSDKKFVTYFSLINSQQVMSSLKVKKEKDEKEITSYSIQIDQLKAINSKLRSKIKELNQVVEKALEKANSKRIIKQKHSNETVKNISHLIEIRDKEILNAQQQIDFNNYELQMLQAKLAELNGVDMMLLLEQRLKESKIEKQELEKQIKLIQKQNNDQGKSLDKLTNDVEYHSKIKGLIEELRVWKEKVKKIENTFDKDKETRKEQIERLKKIEEENKKYMEELELLKSKRKIISDVQQDIDLEKIQIEKDELQNEFIEEDKKQKLEIKQLEKRVQELNIRAEQLRKDLKEKEQEQRISTYKVNDLKRSVKHNQLRPLKKRQFSNDRENEQTAESTQQQNIMLNKQALTKHNKIMKEKTNKQNKFQIEDQPGKTEKKFDQFEQDDQIEDEVEKQIEQKLREQEKLESELDKNQVIPENLGKKK